MTPPVNLDIKFKMQLYELSLIQFVNVITNN